MKNYILLITITILLLFSISTVVATDNIGVLENGTNVTLNETHNVSDVINIDGDDYYVESIIKEPSEIIGYEDGSKIVTKPAYNESKVEDYLVQSGTGTQPWGNFLPPNGKNTTYTYNVFSSATYGKYGMGYIDIYFSGSFQGGGFYGRIADRFYFQYYLDENGNVKYIPMNNISVFNLKTHVQTLYNVKLVNDILISLTEDGILTVTFDMTGANVAPTGSNPGRFYIQGYFLNLAQRTVIIEHDEEFYYEQIPIYSEEKIIYILKKVQVKTINETNEDNETNKGQVLNYKKPMKSSNKVTLTEGLKPPVKNSKNNKINIVKANMKQTGLPISIFILLLLIIPLRRFK